MDGARLIWRVYSRVSVNWFDASPIVLRPGTGDPIVANTRYVPSTRGAVHFGLAGPDSAATSCSEICRMAPGAICVSLLSRAQIGCQAVSHVSPVRASRLKEQPQKWRTEVPVL